MTYFLDSNVIIDLLSGNTNVLQKFKSFYSDSEVLIPDIVYYEILRGFYWKDPKNQLSNFEIFARTCGIKSMDLETFRIAARIYADLMKNGNKLDDDGDILLASLSIQNDAVLVTNNTKHFERINNIQLENWTI